MFIKIHGAGPHPLSFWSRKSGRPRECAFLKRSQEMPTLVHGRPFEYFCSRSSEFAYSKTWEWTCLPCILWNHAPKGLSPPMRFWSQHWARLSTEGTVKAGPGYLWSPTLHDPPTLHIPQVYEAACSSPNSKLLCAFMSSHMAFQNTFPHFSTSSFRMLFWCHISQYSSPLRRLCPSWRKLIPSRKLQSGVEVMKWTTPVCNTASVFCWAWHIFQCWAYYLTLKYLFSYGLFSP